MKVFLALAAVNKSELSKSRDSKIGGLFSKMCSFCPVFLSEQDAYSVLGEQTYLLPITLADLEAARIEGKLRDVIIKQDLPLEETDPKAKLGIKE